MKRFINHYLYLAAIGYLCSIPSTTHAEAKGKDRGNIVAAQNLQKGANPKLPSALGQPVAKKIHHSTSSDSSDCKKCYHTDSQSSSEDTKINIFHFGESSADPGNNLYEPQPAPQIVANVDIPLAPPAEFNIRFNPSGAPGNGHEFGYYTAQSLGFTYLRGSEVKKVACPKGNYINFSLSGAAQNGNIYLSLNSYTPPPPAPDFLTYTWEIQTFQNLLNANPHLKVTSKDIFLYQAVGLNELYIYVLTGLTDINTFTSQYVNATLANLTLLYNKGMRRCFLTLFDFDGTNPDVPDLGIFPGWLALSGANAPNATLDYFDSLLATMQTGLQAALDTAISSNTWPGLELNIFSMAEYYGNLIDNAPIYGIVQPVTGTYTPYDLNTIVGIGAWPASSPAPIFNAQNLLFADSLHFTEHSQKLTSNFFVSWFEPLSGVKENCRKYCKKKNLLKPKTPSLPQYKANRSATWQAAPLFIKNP